MTVPSSERPQPQRGKRTRASSTPNINLKKDISVENGSIREQAEEEVLTEGDNNGYIPFRNLAARFLPARAITPPQQKEVKTILIKPTIPCDGENQEQQLEQLKSSVNRELNSFRIDRVIKRKDGLIIRAPWNQSDTNSALEKLEKIEGIQTKLQSRLNPEVVVFKDDFVGDKEELKTQAKHFQTNLQVEDWVFMKTTKIFFVIRTPPSDRSCLIQDGLYVRNMKLKVKDHLDLRVFKTSLIDVTFYKGSGVIDEWSVSDDFGLGDHAPICFDFLEPLPGGFSQRTRCPSEQNLRDFNYYRCNWGAYKDHLETMKPNWGTASIESSSDLISRGDALVKLIQSAAALASPKKRSYSNQADARPKFFDQELRRKRAELKRAERVQSPSRRALRNEYRRLVISKKEEVLKKSFENLEDGHISNVFRAARGGASRTPARLLEDDNTIEQSANRLADHYIGPRASGVDIFERAGDVETGAVAEPSTSFEVSQEEISSLIERRQKSFDSAPGIDGIRLRHWHESPPWVKTELGKLIGFSYENGYLPRSWKHSRTIMLDKPKKDRKSVKSLRPIALCSTLSKIAEAYLRQFLEQPLEAIRNAGRQCAYLASKSTIDVISSSVKFACDHKKWCLISLDYSNAFGEVSHSSIISSLESFGVDSRTRKWVESWLAGRTSELEYGNVRVHRQAFAGKGTPPGALLSPFLFIIDTESVGMKVEAFVSGLEEVECCEWKCYADDSYLLISWRDGVTDEDMRSALRRIIEFVRSESAVINLVLEPSKMTLMTNQKRALSGLSGYNNVLRQLGFTFTSGLNFHEHLSGRLTLAKQFDNIALRKCGAMLGRRQGLSVGLFIEIYNKVLLPVILYAHEVWGPLIANKTVREEIDLYSTMNSTIFYLVIIFALRLTKADFPPNAKYCSMQKEVDVKSENFTSFAWVFDLDPEKWKLLPYNKQHDTITITDPDESNKEYVLSPKWCTTSE
ncbi:hypothetical protein FOZ60_014607 [Perkinsus olseni]|uniref:Reverse transcriptase domain-containing protein n=1 Tax=Perkinsus olseni TaxID=32597 RepID=A0A7J6PM66_PEROL|nr:hypothetical protein FOZ60_014607 [Perkinsus olseni]